ncbi:glyoxalase [Opitutaceae bacterium EW11]|nr:glyoxalase [Opitutaceae bacterium EW11]
MGRLFDHIDLRVHRMEECAPFYREFLPLLGFTERVEIEGWLQFEARGAGITEFFGLTEDRGHRPNRTRIAFWAETREQLDAIARELLRIGARNIEGPESIDPTYYAIYFEDPSGNALEICHRERKFNDP